MGRQGPHFMEGYAGQVFKNRMFELASRLAPAAVHLLWLTVSWVSGGIVLLEAEDHGADVPTVEPADDGGHRVGLRREYVGSL